MRSILSALLLLVVTSFSLIAQYQLDTVTTYQAGPGVKYSKIMEASGPNIIYVLETDLRNPSIRMQTVKAKNLKAGLERPSVMAAQQEAPGYHVVGITNADFFLSDYTPDNLQVIKGEITRKHRSGYASVGFDASNRYMLANSSFKGSILTKGAAITIDSVDELRGANQLIIYNSYYGSVTPASAAGTEAVLRPIDDWAVNDTVHCIVQSIGPSTGVTPIVKGQMVLSAAGTRAVLLNANVKAGDTVGVSIDVGSGLKKIKEVVGGRPIFFKNGKVDSSVAGISVVAVRNPRTIVGFSQDSSKCYLIVIDGRQATSVGMDIYEMSRLMSQFHIYQAMNFDGGGSATLCVNGETVNTPSDGAERAVSNGLMVISSEPMGGAQTVKIAPRALKIFPGKQYQFTYTARDKYLNRLTLAASEISYTCDARIGSVSPSGMFSAATVPDSGYVYVRHETLVDSSFIRIIDIKKLSVGPKSTVADSTKYLRFAVTAYDADGIRQDVPPSDLRWKSTNPSVGTIDTAGNFKGLRNGSTSVIATYFTMSDTATVTVEIGAGTAVLDAMDAATGWTISADHVDSVSVSAVPGVKTQGSASLKIDYSYIYDPASISLIYLAKPIRIFGIPDTVLIDARSNGMRHRLYYQLSDDNGELFRSVGRKYLEDSTQLSPIPAQFTGMQALTSGAAFNFPVTITRIELQLAPGQNAGQVMAGTIYLDNLRAKYPAAVTAVGRIDRAPSGFALEQNYPNPFNPSTMIEFTIPARARVQVNVYDVLGRETAVIVNGEFEAGRHMVSFNASGLPSGMYFYSVKAGAYSAVKKMMLLR